METYIEDFKHYVNNKIKNYTDEQKLEYFTIKDNNTLSQYNIDYLNFYKRDKISELGESKFF